MLDRWEMMQMGHFDQLVAVHIQSLEPFPAKVIVSLSSNQTGSNQTTGYICLTDSSLENLSTSLNFPLTVNSKDHQAGTDHPDSQSHCHPPSARANELAAETP